MTNKILITAYFSLAFQLFSFAAGGGVVEIDLNATREVEPAYRIAEEPAVIDTTLKANPVDYPLLSMQMETSSDMNNITPATINIKEPLSELYHTYVRLGFSTELMPFGDIYFDGNRSRKFIYGAHVNHLSSYGDIPGYAPAQFDRTKGLLYGGINEKRYTARADIRYRNQGLHYFGLADTLMDTLGLTRDSLAQRYSDFGLGGYFNWHKRDSAKLNLTVGLDYNNFMTKKPFTESIKDWRGKENAFNITSNWWYKFEQHVFSADFNIKYNGYRYGIEGDTLSALDTSITLNNTIVNLKPMVTTYAFDGKLRAKAGMDLNIDAHRKTKAYVYPILEAKYSLFNDILIPYAGLRGGLKQTTLKSITQENEFVLPNLNFLNESTTIDFYAGIKGTLSKRIGFNTGISFARIRNFGMFVTDTVYSPSNKFTILYDSLTRTTIDASISYQLMEKIKIDAIGKFHSYTLLNNSYAWNMPRIEALIRGSYNLADKFLATVDFKLEEGRKALVYAPGDGIKEENGQYYKDLGIIPDVNLGLEYRWSSRLSGFVQMNNIASQRYMRWYNTPVQSFQFLGGFSFRF